MTTTTMMMLIIIAAALMKQPLSECVVLPPGDFWEILREETFGLGAMQSLSAHVHSNSGSSSSSHHYHHHHHHSPTSDLHAELGLTSELHSDFYDFGLIPEL
ncbi:unnamed protein product [Lampetra fluviatilis]